MNLIEAGADRIRELAGRLVERVAPNVPLSPAVEADEKILSSPLGRTLAYYDRRAKRAEAKPLVLVHSVNACASTYEMRPLFEHYRALRPTYALDLPGFGRSERDDRPYTVDGYAGAVRELLAWVRANDGEADVIALSLSGEFAARVAVDDKDLVRSLAILSPTGFDAKRSDSSPLRYPLEALRRDPVASRLVFDGVSSHKSVSFFLGKAFVGPPDRGLVDYAYATSHQPAAQYAPLDFLAGVLFTRDVRENVYARVSCPSLVVYDTDPFVKFDALPAFVARHSSWRSERIVPTRGMPQFEQLPRLTRTLESFWHAG
jgi:pimeloyl-ACP methyl ester carboxylesterase